MELSRQDLVDVLRIVEEADVEYLHLEVGDTRLTVSRRGVFPDASEPTGNGRAAPLAAGEVSPEAASGEAARVETAPAPAVPDGCVAVTAPTLGVFYRRPEPGAAPFVENGATVAAGATVALIEVMKVFNAVTSPVDGIVEAILVEDEELVEYGQTIVAIRATE